MKKLAILFAAVATLAAAPTVTKVEPPYWWTGHSINPVRLLIRGTGLSGASVKAAGKGIELGVPRANANGTYLFVDATIHRAGAYPLKITTADGSATAAFEVRKPLARENRFQGFSEDDLIYLIMPDRFSNGDAANDDPAVSKGLFDRSKPRYYHGGDLQGVIDRLPYLKDLGVTAIWLNPVYDNVNHVNEREKYDGQAITDYHGYGAVDFYSVDEHLGDMAKLQELVDAAHRSGIKTILDMVANHTGPYHPWVQDPPTPTWFHGTASKHVTETWQTWTLMDPHAPPSLQAPTLDGWFLDILPDLNQDDPETARYIIQNTLWWVAATRLGWHQAGHASICSAQVLARLVGAPSRRNIRSFAWWVKCSMATPAWFHSSKAAAPVSTVWIPVSTRCSIFQRSTRFGGRLEKASPSRNWPRCWGTILCIRNPNNLVTFLGLHDVSRFMNEPGATVDGLKLAFTFLLTSRGIPHDLLRRRDRYAGRYGSG